MPTTAARPSRLLGAVRHAHLFGLGRSKPAAPAKPASAKAAAKKTAVGTKPAPRFAHLHKAATPAAITRAAELPSRQAIAASWDAAAVKAGAKPSSGQQAKVSHQPSTTAASWDRAAEKAGIHRHRAS